MDRVFRDNRPLGPSPKRPQPIRSDVQIDYLIWDSNAKKPQIYASITSINATTVIQYQWENTAYPTITIVYAPAEKNAQIRNNTNWPPSRLKR